MRKVILTLITVLGASLFLTSCAGGPGGNSTTQFSKSGTVFITGSDAPLASVLSFQITVNSLTLSDGSNSVSVLNAPATIEFSRLLGLRTLLALNSVPAGQYKSATVSISTPVISFLDLSTNPASVGKINGTLTTGTITVNFRQPLTIADSGIGGLHFHFDLRNSIQLDSTGQVTGVVNPHIGIRPLTIDDDDAEVDELKGGLVSTNVAGNSFVLQRPDGRNITVNVNSQTMIEGASGLSGLVPPAFIEVSGKIQADGSLLADHVEFFTAERAFLSGLVLNPIPPTGVASSVTMLVNEELPSLAGIPVGGASTINISSATDFDIFRWNMPVSTFLFNNSQLVRGQRIAVGGAINTTTNPASLDTRRVVLYRQGLDGNVSANSVVVQSGNTGTFQLAANGFFGFLFGGPVKVQTSDATRFRDVAGLSGLKSVTVPVRVVGLLLKDSSGNPVLVANRVEAEVPED
jgi:hypothetical protein